jgi:hypothetical protein
MSLQLPPLIDVFGEAFAVRLIKEEQLFEI